MKNPAILTGLMAISFLGAALSSTLAAELDLGPLGLADLLGLHLYSHLNGLA